MSGRLTPAAVTCTRSCVGPGTGIGRVASVRDWLVVSATMHCMDLAAAVVSVRRRWTSILSGEELLVGVLC